MIINGKKIAQEIEEEIKATLLNIHGRPPCLAVIIVGDHPASQIYVQRKTQACKNVGILSLKIHLPSSLSEQELLDKIHALNLNSTVDGILVQLPLPPHINPSLVNLAILPEKDVDGFHPFNVGKMLMGETDGFFPCTPLGIRALLARSQIEVAGRHVLIAGRSNIVGKPMAAMLMQNNPEGNATVTIAHSKTKKIDSLTSQADIIILAMGQPLFLKADMIKEGVTVIDVGINKINDLSRPAGYRLVGDADFDHIKDKCAYITPVPGGVGPMTIAMLLSNTLKSYSKRLDLNLQKAQ
jgi:methylenetetrahydrofolate dehydrogenase (NADP+)/methenyltetrahydrofolate cyclohydrolase